MIVKSKRGQTALEYLLILVVALALVVAVFVFTQSTTEEIQDSQSATATTLINPRGTNIFGYIIKIVSNVLYTQKDLSSINAGDWVLTDVCYQITDVQTPCDNDLTLNCIITDGGMGQSSAQSFIIYSTQGICNNAASKRGGGEDPPTSGYNGEFNSREVLVETYSFVVEFNDSSIDVPSPIPWSFSFDSSTDTEGDCIVTNPTESLNQVSNIPIGESQIIGDLFLQTIPGSFCGATVTATAPDGFPITGTYLVDARDVDSSDHLMSEYEEIDYSEIELEYDCDEQELRLDLKDDALKYYIFTDDLLLDGTEHLSEILFAGRTCTILVLNKDELIIRCGDGLECEWEFEDDERYTEQATIDDDGIWELDFNGGDAFTVADLESLESAGTLYISYPPYDISPTVDSENLQADEYSTLDPTTRILRFLEFSLEREVTTGLPIGGSIGFPFTDDYGCFTNTKSFTYNGLLPNSVQSNIEIDTSGIEIEKSDGSTVNLHRRVEIDYADEWGDGQLNVRLDEGPFQDGDQVLICDVHYRIDSIEYNDTYNGVIVEYSIKDGDSWTMYDKDSENDPGDAMLFDTAMSASWNSVTISSMVSDLTSFDMSPGWEAADPHVADAVWIIRNLTKNDESLWEIWVDKNNNGVLDLATTCATSCCGSGRIPIEFTDSGFCAYDDIIVVDGDSGSGAEDEVMIDLVNGISIMSEGCVACVLDDNDCEEIAEDGRDGGALISLSGATVLIGFTEVESPPGSGNDEDIITSVVLNIPEEELSPQINFIGDSKEKELTCDIYNGDEMNFS